MASSFAFQCWKCGAAVADEPMPLSREARCRACGADLHCCRQCRWYDTSKAKACAEPVADEVRDKERANFCGYFAINAEAHAGGAEAEQARRRLASLFGLEDAAGGEAGASAPDAAAAGEERRRREAEEAKARLSKLFGLDEG